MKRNYKLLKHAANDFCRLQNRYVMINGGLEKEGRFIHRIMNSVNNNIGWDATVPRYIAEWRNYISTATLIKVSSVSVFADLFVLEYDGDYAAFVGQRHCLSSLTRVYKTDIYGILEYRLPEESEILLSLAI